MNQKNKVQSIEQIVENVIKEFARDFRNRHTKEKNNPEGVINRKIHNVFISELSKDILYYTALVRSFDSSLGNMLENLAIQAADISYKVNRKVFGQLYLKQTEKIAELLESYKNRTKAPNTNDYQTLRSLNNAPNHSHSSKRHESDYYLIDRYSETHYLIELKIGGDLDSKKARSEKEALLEQFSILSNSLDKQDRIEVRFATAYNKDGEGNQWKQTRVTQFFAQEELLIGKDFWNFITKREDGYEIILNSYKRNCHYINKALDDLKKLYL